MFLNLKTTCFTSIIFMVIFFTMSDTKAQSAFGLKGGGNYNYLGYSFEEGYGDRFGYTYGGFGLIQLSPVFYLNPELNYTYKSLDLYTPVYLNDVWIDNNVRLGLNYLDIPLNFGYGGFIEPDENIQNSVPMFFMLYAGPQFNFLTGQNNSLVSRFGNTNSTIELSDIDEIRKTDIGLNLGVTLGAANLYVDVRYYLAFSGMLKYDTEGDAMNTISLTVGYMFVFR